MNVLALSRNALMQARAALRSFHENERADVPVGTILLIAFIVVPLVLLLIIYRKDIVDYFQEEFGNLKTEGKEEKRPGL